MFRLKLLGPPSIAAEDGSPLSGAAAQRYRLALLALLGVGRPGGLSRERATSYLWPDRDPEHARQLLNQSVYQIRKSLGEETLLSFGDELRLNPAAVRLDVLEFESACDRQDHAEAVRVYAGPFLDGFFLSETPEFEQWVERERERLGDRHARSLEALATAAEEEGDLAAAVELWKSRAALDRFDSRVVLRLLRALEASGNAAGAVRVARAHERLLREELDLEPPPEIASLVARLRAQDEAAPRVRREGPEPTGRPEPIEASGALEAGGSAAGERAPPAGVAAPEERVRSGSSTAGPEEDERSGSGEAAGEERERPFASEERLGPRAGEVAAEARPFSVAGAMVARRHRRSPVAVAALSAAGALIVALAGWWWISGRNTAAAASTAATEPSIAVLPLATPGRDPADAALADAIAEELITRLGRTPGVRVVSRVSSFAFRNSGLGAGRIADSLGVSHILEGGVQRRGQRLRVAVRLVDPVAGTTLWSETFDGDLEGIFGLQEEIARTVAVELGTRLASAGPAAAPAPPTTSVAAYEFYLKGSDPTLLRSDSAAAVGIEYFRQAIALDSSYAAAYAGLARLYTRTLYTLQVPERERQLALAEEAARRAVQLDPDLAEARATLGAVRMISFDFETAEEELGAAIGLDPSEPVYREWLVTLHLWTGRPEEALRTAEIAIRLDPLSPSANGELARALLFNGRCDEALERLERLSSLQPPILRAASIAAQCYAERMMWDEAVAALTQNYAVGSYQVVAQLGWLNALAGRRQEAARYERELFAAWPDGRGAAFGIAMIHAGLGDFDQAFAWLERSIDDRSLNGAPGGTGLLQLMSPYSAGLRADPRFAKLRERLFRRGR